MDATSLLASMVSVTLLAYLVFWLWRDYSVDRYRLRLFVLRDKLFETARAGTGGVRFDSAAYIQLRTTINGQIRFADLTDLITGPLTAVFLGNRSAAVAREYEAEWSEALSQLDAEGARLMNQFRDTMHRETLRHAVFSGPHITLLFLGPLTIAVVGVLAFGVITGALRQSLRGIYALRRQIQSLVDASAFDEGCPVV